MASLFYYKIMRIAKIRKIFNFVYEVYNIRLTNPFFGAIIYSQTRTNVCVLEFQQAKNLEKRQVILC